MRITPSSFIAGVVLVLSLMLAGSASGQSTITGRVIDPDGQPVQNAAVSTGGVTVLTDAQGRFTLSVAPGRHSVTVDAQESGFAQYETAVTVADGATENLEIRLSLQPVSVAGVVVTVVPTVTQELERVPALVNVVERDEIEGSAVATPSDNVIGMPAVDFVETGVNQRTVVTRGFNNVFSGSLLVLQDYRYARVPSLRFNAHNMIPATNLDIERIDVVVGPASALYGPNSANGIMHIITTSPIDRPGTSVSIAGGNREIFNGAFRQAFNFNDRAGLKISGNYFRGNDFQFNDPSEVVARDFNSEKWGGEARFDLRPWAGSNDGVTLTYGLNKLVNSVEMTGVGAAQAKDWKYEFGQIQFRRSGFFWQAFLNRSDAGETFLLRRNDPLVDKSTVFVTQGQYAFSPVDRLELVGGVDLTQTTPKTEGTITGSNEDMDETREIGGFAQATLALTDQLDLIGALRVDDHQHLEDPVWSPRVGLVYEPVEGHAFRGAYNRAFSTPTTNNLFLDLVFDQIPLAPLPFDINIRTTGVPSSGYTWTNQCPGGFNNYCMYSPFLEGTQLPASGTLFWDNISVPAAMVSPAVQTELAEAGWTVEQFQAAVQGATPADIESTLRRFNQEALTFLPDQIGPVPVDRLLPTITTTYEVGYQGLIRDKVRISAGVYRNEIRDFVGPLRVETPTVFLDPASAATFIATRLIVNGMAPADAADVAQAAAAPVASIPYGTVAPDQRSDSDLVLTYRNFGDVNHWGADLGVEVYLTDDDDLTLTGAYSWVSKECFDFDEDGDCSSVADIALNAPAHKGSLGIRYSPPTGLGFSARMRYTDDFPMNSGVYVGDIDSYAVFDANVAYRVPGYEGFIVSATVNNVFDNKHREFIGAPEIGRVALVQLQYAIGN